MNISEKYGIPQYKRMQFNSNGKIVSKVDDWRLILGTGTNDYLAFLSTDVDSNGDLTVSFRAGTDHNQTPNGDIAKFKYTQQNIIDKATVSSYDTLVANGGRQLTDPSVFVTSTGRIIIFFLIEPTGFRQMWLKYSDDGGTTWSAEIRMTTDYSDNQITGPGEAFEVSGAIYKPCYARGVGAGSREGPLYKSIDNGVTWTKMPMLMYQIESFNGEEPSMKKLSNGAWLGFVRSDPDNKIYKIYSLDGGVTYSRIADAFPGLAKCGFDISPSGTIFGISRENGGTFRSIYFYSNDKGKTFVTGYADARTGAVMYGRAVWHRGLNQFVAVYAVETSTPNVGPTEIVCATFNEI